MAVFSSGTVVLYDQSAYTNVAHSVNSGTTLVIASDCTNRLNNIVFDTGSGGSYQGGTLLFDGYVLEIQVASTSGASVGLSITGGTSGATGIVTQVLTSPTRIKYRSPSSTQFINGETVTGSGYSSTIGSIPQISNITVLGQEGSAINSIPEALVQFDGCWYELGTSNGSASQTFTNYSAGNCAGIWVQKGYTVTITNGSANISATHELKVGDIIRLNGTLAGTGFSTNTPYYVLSSDYDGLIGHFGSTFTLSSDGATAITATGGVTPTALHSGANFTSSGSGTILTTNLPHELTTGDTICFLSSNSPYTLPSPLNPYLTYEVYNVVDSTHIEVCLEGGTSAITFTSTGSGTHSILPDSAFYVWKNIGDRDFTTVGGDLNHGLYCQQFNSSTITLGDGTNGAIPVNGAIVRVPNITITCTTGSTPSYPTDAGSFYYYSSNGSGKLYIRKTILSGVYLSARNLASALIKQIGIWFAYSIGNCNFIDDVVDFCFSQPTTASSYFNYSSIFSDMDSVTIRGLYIVAINDYYPLLYCPNSTFLVKGGHLSSFKSNNFSEGTFEFGSIVSNNTFTELRITNSITNLKLNQDVTFSNCFISNSNTGDLYAGNGYAIRIVYTKGCLIENVQYGSPSQGLIGAYGSNTTIKNIGSASSPIDLQSNGSSFIEVGGSNITIQNVFVTGIAGGGYLFRISSKSSNILFLNSGDYGTGEVFTASVTNLQMRGCRASSLGFYTYGMLNTGIHFNDIFTSSTVGQIYLYMYDSSAESAFYVTKTGNPLFTSLYNEAVLALRTVGDSITWEQDYFAQAHTGLVSVGIANFNNSGNHTVQYQIDKGSGWNGTWKTLNNTNLAAESGITPSTGVKLKIKVTCITSSPTNLIGTIVISTTSTALAQAAIDYPIADTTITITGLVAGSEVRLFNVVSDVDYELGGTESTSGTSFSVSFVAPSSSFTARLFVIKQGYKVIDRTFTLQSGNQSIFIQQDVDRNFSNP